jgi:hypothetical protein
MAYRVKSAFRGPSGDLVEPGAEVPDLPQEEIERLIKAGCLVEDDGKKAPVAASAPKPPPGEGDKTHKAAADDEGQGQSHSQQSAKPAPQSHKPGGR